MSEIHTEGKYVVAIAIVAVVILFFWPTCSTFGGIEWEYSSGFRNGTLSKFSNKGLVFKTWEGEAILGGLRTSDNGSVANLWEFSVKDDAVAKQLNEAMTNGVKVRLHYSQVLIRDWKDSSTDYIVHKVEILNE